MKRLLITIVLLSSIQYAFADVTLEFKELKNNSHLTYNIKQQHLRFVQSGQKRINLFDADKQLFVSFDPATSKRSIINQAVLDKRVLQLNQQRLSKLAKVEKQMADKLKTMTPSEKEIGESLVNLIKYPDIYGEHTQLKLKKTARSKEIERIQCDVYQLYRKDVLLKDVCLAAAKSLKINSREYKTLRSLYAFDYSMQFRLMLAMGKTRFSLINYDEENVEGVVIESIDYHGADISQHLILDKVSHSRLADGVFTLPPS